jgi:hypothetical protein
VRIRMLIATTLTLLHLHRMAKEQSESADGRFASVIERMSERESVCCRAPCAVVSKWFFMGACC